MIIEDIRNIDLEKIHNIDASDNESFVRAPKKYMRNYINLLNFITIENFKRRFRFSKDFVKYGILPKLKNEII